MSSSFQKNPWLSQIIAITNRGLPKTRSPQNRTMARVNISDDRIVSKAIIMTLRGNDRTFDSL